MAREDDARWVPLGQYLALKRRRQDQLELSFRQIESVLGDALPKPARKDGAWWENTAATPQARAWQNAGWSVRAVDVLAEQVVFESPPGE
jgi:hypothetical protein